MRSIIVRVHASFHKALSHMRQHSLLVPTLVSTFSFIGAVLLILSIWFARNVIGTMEQTLYENASSSSSKAANMLESSFRDIIDTSTHLENISAISPRAYLNDPYHAYQTLRLLNSAKYSDLLLCYESSPRLLTLYGTCYAPVYFPDVDNPQALIESIHSMTSISLISTTSFGAQWNENQLLLCYPLSSQHTAVFVLASNLIANTVSVAAGASENIQVLFDATGEALWSSQPIDLQRQQQLYSLVSHESSSTRTVFDQTDYIFSSNSVGYGATLAVLEKITTQFDHLKMATNMLIVICVSIILLGMLSLFYTIRKSYVPIANLVHDLRTVLPEQQEAADSDIATLRHAYSQYSTLMSENKKKAALFSPAQLRSLFVLRTISGQYSDATELDNLCRCLQIDFPHRYFFACLLLFDGISCEQEKREIETHLYQEYSTHLRFYFYLLPDGHSAVGIVNVPESGAEQLSSFGEQILSHLPENISATMGIGQIYPDITCLGKSYLEAHAALDYRLIKGKNTFITYSEISFPDEDSHYPHQLINSYINTVRTWDVDKIRDKLQQISEYIHSHSLPLQQVKCICFDLTSSFLREVSSLDQHVVFKSGASYDVFNIAEYGSVSELSQKIVSFSESIYQYVAKHAAYQANDLVAQCKEYMRANISNVQFALSSCAEKFDIAPQTLRRKFKEATGQTLSNYMTAIRIEHACFLLTHSTLDVNEICIRCGYLDLSSFIRLFKQETGVSPGVYRDQNQQRKA